MYGRQSKLSETLSSEQGKIFLLVSLLARMYGGGRYRRGFRVPMISTIWFFKLEQLFWRATGSPKS